MLLKNQISKFAGILLLSLFFTFISQNLCAESGGNQISFNKEFSLEKSNDLVTITTQSNCGETVSYKFKDFHADVLFFVYQGRDLEQMIKELAGKYKMTETESRRRLKRTVNTMELWSIVTRG